MSEQHKTTNLRELIRAKKNDQPLTEEQIQFWVNGVVDKSIPEYQITALLMLVFWKGMSIEERSFLTKAMARSGTCMDYSAFPAQKVDKHSTGGIGDKTSLIIAPLAACLGLLNPMVAGRGLGHTGGTIDKLEAIPGYNAELNFEQMSESIKEVGTFISGQTEQLAPADKVIYALRDVTETVDEISLITASILSKKLSEDLNGLTLDVKCGTGAFMQNFNDAARLAYSLIQTANKAGVNCQGVITRMDYPLGEWSGNSCEVYECIEAMTPGSKYCEILERLVYDETIPGQVKIENKNGKHGAADIKDLLVYFTVVLTLNMVIVTGGEPKQGLENIIKAWKSGDALQKFKQMVAKQGGDYEAYLKYHSKIQQQFETPSSNANIYEFKAPFDGKIKSLKGQSIGNMLVALGAGRKVKTDKIDFDVSLQWLVHPNQEFKQGDVLARVYHPDATIFKRIQIDSKFNDFISFAKTSENYTDNLPLVYAVVTKDLSIEQIDKIYQQ